MLKSYHIAFRKSHFRRGRPGGRIAADFELPYYTGTGYLGCGVNEIVENLRYPLRQKSSSPILLINEIGISSESRRIFNKIKMGLIQKLPNVKFSY